MGKTTIEWTDYSVNPLRARHKTTGRIGWHCVKYSPGCASCYAEAINKRFGTGLPFTKRSQDEVELVLDLKPLEKVGRMRKRGLKFFLCDQTDLFGEFVPFEWIDRIFEVIAVSPQHTFQILTKRPARMAEYFRGGRPMLGNCWLGCSVEDQQRADERIPHLLEIPAAVRFLSVEPLLAPVDLGLWRVAIPKHRESWPVERVANFWVIVGGESGKGARPCNAYWIRSIVEQCRAAGVATFVKQWGARPFFDATGGSRYDDHTYHKLRDPKGGDISEFPEDLRIREFPRVPAGDPT